MTTRIIAIIVLVAFLNSILGCASTVKVSKDEVRLRQPEEKIVGVVLPSSDVIPFDEYGGRYDPNAEVIIGIDQDGSPIEIQLDDVRQIQVEKVEAGKSLLTSFDVQAFEHLAAFRYKPLEAFHDEKEIAGKIVAVVLYSGDEITFDKSGGNVDARKMTIWGKAQDETPVEVELDHIYYIKIRVPDRHKTRMACCLGGGGALFVGFIIVWAITNPLEGIGLGY